MLALKIELYRTKDENLRLYVDQEGNLKKRFAISIDLQSNSMLAMTSGTN